MIWNISALTSGGTTVMEYRNYMLRFRGALPSISSSMEEMLAGLPDLAGHDSSWDLSGRYIDGLSTRAILGPVSLQRFADRIPRSAAGFPLGANGQVANFETPAGRVMAVAFRYPTADAAKEQANVLAELPNTAVYIDKTCVGVVFGAANLNIDDPPLSGYFCGGGTVAWDPPLMDGDIQLNDGISAVVYGGVIFGAAFAALRRFDRLSDPFPEVMTFLRL
jgi:hypothetical protein